jgi:hypothetical protein
MVFFRLDKRGRIGYNLGMERIIKYPRTEHLEGSGIQVGDEDLNQIPFSEILGKNIVVEEKIDGANVGISFQGGNLLLQSRGHYLSGGYKERHYDLFKIFGAQNRDMLYSILGERYILYGEWTYAKHKIYYDALPSYFIEFDIFDKQGGVFLDTPTRQKMLDGTGIFSAPVLAQKSFKSKNEILALLQKSAYVSPDFEQNLKNACAVAGVNYEQTLLETDLTPLMEGLYIKVESGGAVTKRVKFVRNNYKQIVTQGRWIDKTIIPNKLK